MVDDNDRRKLLNKLKKLTDSQFNEMLLEFKINKIYLRSDRRINTIIDLIELLEQRDNGLVSLKNYLEVFQENKKFTIFNPVFEENKRNNLERILLNRVETTWLEQDFEDKIELQLEKLYSDRPEVITITNIYNTWKKGQNLLILGELGSGKTTTLLTLTKKFFSLANCDNSNDSTQRSRLPVVFGLSSWGNEQTPIYDWLIKELINNYRVSEKKGEDLVKGQNMLLLLDGLNEVKSQHQSACLKAIHEFTQTYGETEIVVCCRKEEYENLDKPLRFFDLVVYVQPLTIKQVNDYLSSKGEHLNDLKKLISEDSVLRELSQTPLILKIMIEVHKKVPKVGLLAERRQELFSNYVEQMFENYIIGERKKYQSESISLPYEKNQVIDWLNWLAQGMSKTSTFFLIEQLQPNSNWLTQEQQKFHQKLSIFGTIILGVLFGIAYGSLFHFYILYFLPSSIFPLQNAVLYGIIQGVIVGPSVAYFQGRYKLGIEIKTYERQEISFENTKNSFFKNTFVGIRASIIIFLISSTILPFFSMFSSMKFYILTGICTGSFFGIVLAISGITNDSFVDIPINKTIKPNQGIWDSLNQALTIGIVSMISIAIIHTLAIIILSKIHSVIFINGLLLALITGFVASLSHKSGNACMQHYILRIVLMRYKLIPKDYANFLEYANEIRLLKRNGGGYKFIHPEFQKYFADIKS